MNELEDHKYYKMNKKQSKRKQLEEFCDCIHAAYSIANTLDVKVDIDYSEIVPAQSILMKYRSLKVSISRFSIKRALNSKIYCKNYLELIFAKLYSIAKAKGFTEEDIVISFVAVYTKNMIRANSDY
jgi:dimeric dUTPase (all-alpha-NTP-PPase superfamily)